MAAGAVTVPAYITNTEADHLHILTDSGARAALVSTQKLAATLFPAIAGAPACTAVIGIDKLRTGVASVGAVRLHDWAALVAAPSPTRRRRRGAPDGAAR